MIHLPQGMVLITGPTGSGKTTTIYSALYEVNQIDTNICTAEDPIEFNLEGINQVQMNPDIDLNFSTALRAFLRQDPDIVMVGEIRDLETAEIAFKAASTGHMVVSTLHTNDAPSTVNRLIEMGIAPYIITSTLSLVVAQRLVGKICEACKELVDIPEAALMAVGVSKADIPKFKTARGRGCGTCNNTGIKGRQAIYELMPMTERIKDAILRTVSVTELRQIARDSGVRTLRRAALLKLARGQTTIEEVINSSVKDSE
jgi:type IV pilus assembly protein PilB